MMVSSRSLLWRWLLVVAAALFLLTSIIGVAGADPNPYDPASPGGSSGGSSHSTPSTSNSDSSSHSSSDFGSVSGESADETSPTDDGTSSDNGSHKDSTDKKDKSLVDRAVGRVTDLLPKQLQGLIKNPVGTAVGGFATILIAASMDVLRLVFSVFFTTEIPGITNNGGNGPTELTTVIGLVSDLMTDFSIIVMVLAMLSVVIRIAMSKSGYSSNHAAEGTQALIRGAVLSVGAPPIIILADQAGEAFSNFCFSTIIGGKEELNDRIVALEHTIQKFDTAEMSSAKVLIVAVALLGLVAWFDILVQLFLQKFYLLVGAVGLPWTGMTSSSALGKSTHDALWRLVATMLAIKPLLALLMSLAFQIGGDAASIENASLMSLLGRCVCLFAPSLALPMILGLFGGAGATTGSHGGGMMAMTGSRMAVAAGASLLRAANNRGGGSSSSSSSSAGAGAGGAPVVTGAKTSQGSAAMMAARPPQTTAPASSRAPSYTAAVMKSGRVQAASASAAKSAPARPGAKPPSGGGSSRPSSSVETGVSTTDTIPLDSPVDQAQNMSSLDYARRIQGDRYGGWDA